MSDHTPGPWRIKGWRGQHDEDGAHIVGPDDQHIASSWGGLREMSPGSEWRRYHSDACLIAAAPDLLEAVMVAVRELEENGADLYDPEVIDTLRSAMKKATNIYV